MAVDPVSKAVVAMLSEEDRRWLLRLARDSLRCCVAGLDKPCPTTINDAVNQPRAVFASLKKNRRLRGCIGTFSAHSSLWECVVEMAERAALKDPRFSPVQMDEVSQIQIELSVLSPMKAIVDMNEVEVGRHGLVVERDGSRGVLLPQVAIEQGWDVQTFLAHTCQKAGLPQDAYLDPASTVWVFEAEVFGEGVS